MEQPFLKHVSLSDDEYKKLVKRFGEVGVERKIKELSRKRREGKLKSSKSDYLSLLRVSESKVVEPIRSVDDIAKVKELFENRSKRDLFLFVMGINVGVRIGDLLSLRVKDIRGKKHLLMSEEKTGKMKKYRINNSLAQTIIDYTESMGDDDYLFPSRKKGLPISRVQAYRIVREVGKEAGLDRVGTHTLRKSFGHHLYQRSKDVALVQEILNHSSPSITKRYIGISQDEIDKAIDDFSL